MSIYAGRDNDGRIVVDVDADARKLAFISHSGERECVLRSRASLDPQSAEKLAHELLALAYDHEANRAAYPPDADAAHDSAVDQALADDAGLGWTWIGPSEAFFDPDGPLQNDNHPENDASGEPDFGGNG